MTHQNHPFHDGFRWLNSFIAKPPYLAEHYSAKDFSEFMRKETYLYSARYAKNYVIIHGKDKLCDVATKSGALLTPVHYGSFFLSGGAIVHQLKLRYTAIVTGRNVAPDEEEQRFWKGVHYRSSRLYQQPLFYTGLTSPKTMLNYIATPGNLLCSLLDVRETGQSPKEYAFNYLGKQVYLQTGPARFAYLAKVPMIPMTIHYNPLERRHHLFLGDPISPGKDAVEMTQQALSALESHIPYQPEQWFFDFQTVFSSPHTPIEVTPFQDSST